MNEYDDILSMPRPVSKRHPRMGAAERAAQFLPFAALTGLNALIEDAVREKGVRPELSENEIEEINRRLQQLSHSRNVSHVCVTYVREDFDSGSVCTKNRQGILSRVDTEKELIVLDETTVIFFSDIFSMEEA